MLAMYQRDPSQPMFLLQWDFSQPMYLMQRNPSHPNPSPLIHLSDSMFLPITMDGLRIIPLRALLQPKKKQTMRLKFAFDNGFTLGIQRTETVKGVPHKIWRNFVCGGTYEPQDGGIALRNSGSNKCECEYVAIMKGAVKKGVVGQWAIRVPDQKGTHTVHPPLTREGLRAFPQARRFTKTPEVRTEIQNMVNARTKPCQILATINKHKDKPLVISKEISNLRTKLLIDYLQGRSPLIALLDKLEKDALAGAVTDVIKNRENVLTHLLFQTDLEDKVDEATYAYLEKNKLPLREHWASYFIDQFQHLKATVTSRSEGKHWASIKSNGSANDTILTLYTTIYDNCAQQLTDYQTAVDTYAGKAPRILTDKVKLQKKKGNGFKFGVRVKQFYKEVTKKLPRHVLVEFDKQRIKADRIEKAAKNPESVLDEDSEALKPCSKLLRTIMGIPCSHEILLMRKDGRGLLMSDFIKRWHLEASVRETSTEVLEPPVGRYAKLTNERGTSD
ncbi:hypothetical protein PsorP6_003361 [Peronosclerospora sorghi]|uniref:Uncharacterized protein n=1 Tax=Peronosclerospora sorghi TaxID=230839 RepID=A0ACC0VII2_9STRA|nr:hypothetical protein PsorP6_003361 [Peronosclerospora sorghi]